MDILQTVSRHRSQLDQRGSAHVVELLDTFQITVPAGSHECIVMPVLGGDFNSHARRFEGARIPVRIMKQLTKQLLAGLEFLHDTCRVIHTDLKPSNICFEVNTAEVERMAAGEGIDEVTPICTETNVGNVRIIDLGVASWIDKYLTYDIQAEHLRAPEVILGAPWGAPVDIWSLGCLIIQFVKSHVTFPGKASKHGTWSSSDDHLAQQMELLGPMPEALLARGSKTRAYFDTKGSLLRIPNLKTTTLRNLIDGTQGPLRRPHDMSVEEVPIFVDFLRGALALDPDHRQSAAQLLWHDWLDVDDNLS